MHQLKKISVCLVLLLVLIAGLATAAPAEELQLSGEIRYVNLAGGFYGIVGDDGVRYQPLNLPYKFRKDGLAVKFTALPKNDTVTFLMWGAVVEIVNMEPITGTATDAERTALYVMQKRMDAYNAKDLGKLQQVDLVAKDLTPEQFSEWLGSYENFTLRYLEVETTSGVDITGQAWYTREMVKPEDGSGIMELGIARFTLDRRKDGWRLVALSSVPAPAQKLSLEELLEKARNHYGTEDVTKLLR
ncbi:MAG TPA: hypothetical protein VN611_03205 [Patescibacteria group bacterium]|nr:hypothetical protein [Patescibacteria group bacterium]